MKNFRTKEGIIIFFKGFLMGIADLVPGISGSTVAIMLGIYQRFISALSNFSIAQLRALNLKRFSINENFSFLIKLSLGIICAFALFSKVIFFCMTIKILHEMFFSFFLGAVIAALFFLIKEIKINFSGVFFILSGILFCNVLGRLNYFGASPDLLSVGKLFLAGNLAICAMLLPGISGSYVLMVLGVYPFAINALAHITEAGHFKIIMILFSGIVSGLIIYPKIIGFFLTKKYFPTLNFLIGLVIGSLSALWPFWQYRKIVFMNKTILVSEKLYFPGFLSLNFIFSLLFIIFGFFIFYKIKLISDVKIKKITK